MEIRAFIALACFACAPLALGQATVGVFTGGDEGEGLDLDGRFVYAVAFAGPAAGPVQDANFTDDSAPGVSVSAEFSIVNWTSPDFGPTTNDNNLETAARSIRWSSAPETVGISLANLDSGRSYKLQLLFTEGCCERGFDVFVEGNLVADNFGPYQYISSSATEGAVVTYEFIATDSTLDITLDGVPTSFPDQNPTISALTLEQGAFPAEVPALDAKALALLGLMLAAAATVILRR